MDNNNTAISFLYTGLTPADYTSTPMDHIWLNHAGKLWMNYPSTFTITSGASVVADGTGNELRMDGVLHTPATLSISSYTMTISSFSYMPDMTLLDVSYGGIFNLGGNTQAPIPNVSTITIESSGTLTHWANSTTALGEQHKLNLTISSMTIYAGGKIDASAMGYALLNGPGAGVGG